MKTNFEQYKDIINENKGEICVDVETGKPQAETTLSCKNCLFYEGTRLSCGEHRLRWLFEEYKPMHKLYQHEVDVLEWLVDEFDASMISWTYKQLGQNWFNGVVDIDNVTIEEILSNYELIEYTK